MPGFKEVKPVVFSSIYPMDSNDYEELKDSMEKLKLNDASLTYDKDNSIALGNGFRCGFLGLLHLEIIQERLERDYDQAVIFTSPSVEYSCTLTNGTEMIVDNPTEFPETKIKEARDYDIFRSKSDIRLSVQVPDGRRTHSQNRALRPAQERGGERGDAPS